MMRRVFWGWDEPVLTKALRVLADETDLSTTLILVPTGESSRRLKEALARAAAERGAAVSVPHLWVPERALTTDADRALAASDMQCRLAWTQILLNADLDKLTRLFPVRPARQDWGWATEMAAAMRELSQATGAGGLSFADIAARTDLAHDTVRWTDLARLEQDYTAMLAQQGVQDLQALKRHRAAEPVLPPGIQRVLVFAAPDLPSLVKRWLAAVAKQLPVTLYVHAPESLADQFDAFGSPLPETWGERSRLSIPLRAESLHLEHDPAAQAHRCVALLHQLAPQQRVALGVCDAEVAVHVAESLAREQVRLYQPDGTPAARHGTVHLLSLWQALIAEASWKTFASLLRVPDVLSALTRASEKSAAHGLISVLEASDDFAERHLPVTLDHALELLPRWEGEQKSDVAHALHTAALQAQEIIASFQSLPLPEAARALLIRLFGEREYQADSPVHRDHITLCSDWLRLCEELHREATCLKLKSSPTELLALSIASLQEQRLADPRGEIDLVMQGWLELLWEPAPALVIAGFNEESVPGILISHPFLPDQLRASLGLASQASRFARDACLLRTIAAQREVRGALHVLCGQWSDGKNALRPSRLLFLCDDQTLPARVAQLFPDEQEAPLEKEPARVLAWPLRPRESGPRPALDRISASRLRAYLSCPFSYYLTQVLGMSTVEVAPRELGAAAFGNLVHESLKVLRTAAGRACGYKVKALEDLLTSEAEQLAHRDHGKRLPVPVRLQLDAAIQRLLVAAQREAELREQGWRTIETEVDVGDERSEGAKLFLAGARFHGTIDRIDSNGAGLLRIIDYKTADQSDDPAKSHLRALRSAPEGEDAWKSFQHPSGSFMEWRDLQLPLYVHAWNLRASDAQIEAAYFNLPKAVDQTDVKPFADLSPEVMASAVAVAEQAVKRINAGRFWPPAPGFDPEAYPGLIHGRLEEAIESASLISEKAAAKE